MENTEHSELEATGNYLQLFLYIVPKKNHDAIVRNLKQSAPWFNKNGVRIEYYQLGNVETQTMIDSAKQSGMQGMDSIDSIVKTRLNAEDEGEEVWIEQHYFRDYKHSEEVYAKMMQDESIEPILKEFSGLILQETNLITGGFRKLE